MTNLSLSVYGTYFQYLFTYHNIFDKKFLWSNVFYNFRTVIIIRRIQIDDSIFNKTIILILTRYIIFI